MYSHFNSCSRLPPVGCPLVIKVGEKEIRAERISYITDKENLMDYKLSNGSVITGRFQWTYT